ncbi:MAG: hypothetical protein PHD15_04620 [Clostridia bacterium]|nr:hypothetical protein [Clostridia bacterium]MDD4387024.1 hypothetical protein [Clostridia bacterium]
MIEKKPLSSNMKLDYYECYAKVVLENKLNYKLILDDKPDLRSKDNTIGIEVTNATDEKNEETFVLGTLLQSNKVRNRNKVLKKIKRNGGLVEEYFISGRTVHDNIEKIIKCLKNKLKKL